MLNVDFKQAIDSLQANPIACGSLCLRAMEELNKGKVKIIDPSNPFVYAMETSVVMYTNGLDRCGNVLNRLYPSNANSYNDLYRHMTDKDYHNRFSSPGVAPVMFFINLDEVKNNAVAMNDGTGRRKLTISRNSQILVADVALTFLYPVDIIINGFGAISVRYDNRIVNPLQEIHDVEIPCQFRRNDRTTYLYFEIPVYQIEIKSSNFSVTGLHGLKRLLKFTDKFYYIRAFMRNDNTSWQEITVKHNPFVIDNDKVTVIANVDTVRNSVEVSIPQIYKNRAMLMDNLRIDIYTTKGDVTIPLFNIADVLFKISWRDHEVIQGEKFAAPMAFIKDYKIASDGTVTNGKNGLTFDELRTRVINRTISSEGKPISSNQLITKLTNIGFDTSLIKDNVTDREFLTTKWLNPPQTTDVAIPAIDCSVVTHSFTKESIQNIAKTMRINKNQIMVFPNTLYREEEGVIDFVSDALRESMKSRSENDVEEFLRMINTGRYFYSPYFILHDFTDNRYITKPLRLDKPSIISKSIENESNTLTYKSSIVQHMIQVDQDFSGYTLYLQIQPSDNLREVNPLDLKMQIRISDEANRSYYWFNGELVTYDQNEQDVIDNTYVYKFHLPTDWEITSQDEILIGAYRTPLKLNGSIDVYTILRSSGLNSQFKSKMDSFVNPKLFNDWTTSNSENYFTLLQEKLVLNLGHHLTHLWRRQRPSLGSRKSMVYDHDVVERWEEDVYAKDEFGNIKFRISDTGDLIYEKIYLKGDVKLDPHGEQIVVHKAGDPILDEKSEPKWLEHPETIFQYDHILFDARYLFVTNKSIIDYRESIKDDIDSWMYSISRVSEELLERTNLYTHPKTTLGLVKVLAEGKELYVPTAQKLNITYTVNEEIIRNADIINLIRIYTVQAINDLFINKKTISNSDLIHILNSKLKDMIIGVKVDGFLNDKYSTVSILDPVYSFSIAKNLVILNNSELVIENDIGINFITHSTLTI